ncbi:transcriptional regulator [Companilactobacillus nodensis DSM 19682 = JCM 14932 = NBRC 107160]|uniref:Transcriptional regulator n=2 Tax=Companilactobacillus nodensis TaxID=460870 RepID=A0A0R1KGS0_9LACO|nr:transcriptional regulator [Companilactobacillus nodensis DSM 19682 = JCM 14932 = NBRC 107160]
MPDSGELNMLEQVFLVKQDVEKYRMLTVIKSLPPQELNLSNISNRMQFTYQKTYNIFQALLEDIMEVAPDMDPKVTKIESIDFSKIAIDTYRLYLVQNSIFFQAFNYGLTNANPSFEAFSNEHFTSKSTLNRRMSAFRSFLKNFGLKISNSTLEIKGDEKSIRWMVYFVYWYIYHGQEWPFKLIKQDDIDDIIDRSGKTFSNPITYIQLEYFLAISRIRLTKRNYINNMSKYNDVFGNQKLGEDVLRREDYSIVPIDALDNENKLLNLFHKMVFQPSAEIYAQPMNFDVRINSKFYALVYHFIDFLKEHYRDDMTVYHNQKVLKDIMTYVSRDIIFYYIMANDGTVRGSYYDKNPEDTKSLSSLYQNILEFFTSIDEKEYHGVYNGAEAIAHDLYQILPSYINTIQKEDYIHVKVLVDPGNAAEEVVLRNVRTLEFVQVVPSDQYEDVDVLISTLDIMPRDYELELYPKNMQVIPWNITNTRTDYIWLLVRLNQVYVDKLKARDADKKKAKK